VSLFTDYLIGVELASMMLLTALAAAFHYGSFGSREEEQDD
jgi:NADH:ubiquinone oxidoreductase subunit 6 (subunit J)